MVVYEIHYEPLETKWLVTRASTPFSVHETLEDARAAAEEHARSESAAEARTCKVVWNREDGQVGGTREFAPRK